MKLIHLLYMIQLKTDQSMCATLVQIRFGLNTKTETASRPLRNKPRIDHFSLLMVWKWTGSGLTPLQTSSATTQVEVKCHESWKQNKKKVWWHFPCLEKKNIKKKKHRKVQGPWRSNSGEEKDKCWWFDKLEKILGTTIIKLNLIYL